MSDASPMPYVFMGSDAIALPLLEALWRAAAGGRLRCAGVFTQPDRRTGRGMKVRENAIKRWALHRALPVRQPPRIAVEDLDWLRAEGVGLVFVMAYGQILKPALLDLPQRGCWNLHASLLPALRGASPIQTAIAEGDRQSGVSLMQMATQLDAGPVLDQERVPIGPRDTAGDLAARLADACVPLVERNLLALLTGSLTLRAQDPAAVTYCRILDKSDALLDFRLPARVLDNRIRAFQPWPGALLNVGETPLRVHAARALPQRSTEAPGTLVVDGQRLYVHCADHLLELLSLQRPGGKPMSPQALLNGFPMPSGTQLPSGDARPLVAPTPFPYKRPGGRGAAERA